MVNAKFHHFGVPTKTRHPDATYLPGGKLFYTDADKHPLRVEFVYFESDSPMPKIIQEVPHAGYTVDNLEAAIAGKRIVLPPTPVNANLRIAFVTEGDALLEFLEIK